MSRTLPSPGARSYPRPLDLHRPTPSVSHWPIVPEGDLLSSGGSSSDSAASSSPPSRATHDATPASTCSSSSGGSATPPGRPKRVSIAPNDYRLPTTADLLSIDTPAKLHDRTTPRNRMANRVTPRPEELSPTPLLSAQGNNKYNHERAPAAKPFVRVRVAFLLLLVSGFVGLLVHTSYQGKLPTDRWLRTVEPTPAATSEISATVTVPIAEVDVQPTVQQTTSTPTPTESSPVVEPPAKETETPPAPAREVPQPTDVPPPPPVKEVRVSPPPAEPVKPATPVELPKPAEPAAPAAAAAVAVTTPVVATATPPASPDTPPQPDSATTPVSDSAAVAWAGLNVTAIELEYPCLATKKTAHLQMLYQLAYDFDQVFGEFQIPYSIEDGSLLGAMRHQGVIPHDDDIDLLVRCDNPEQPCWYQLSNPASPLRAALRERGMDLYFSAPDHKRQTLKVFSTVPGMYVARHFQGRWNYPYIDIFLSRQIRCNVSEHLTANEWRHLVSRSEWSFKGPELNRYLDSLQLYETDIWAYHAQPDPFKEGCSVLWRTFNYQSLSEIFPQHRYKFGPVEMWGPKKGAQVLRRAISGTWDSALHRSTESHIGTGMIALPEYPEYACVREPGSPPSSPMDPCPADPKFKPCGINLNLVKPEVRAWMTRPGGEQRVDKRPPKERTPPKVRERPKAEAPAQVERGRRR